jgi:hypothetical protein
VFVIVLLTESDAQHGDGYDPPKRARSSTVSAVDSSAHEVPSVEGSTKFIALMCGVRSINPARRPGT